MYCQICKKKSATVHFTELNEGKKVEVHICQDCADEKGFLLDMGNYASKLFSGLAGKKTGVEKTSDEACRSCGMKYSDFKSSGRLGCGECYEVFRLKLGGVIRKIHGSSLHVGKSPDLTGEALRRREIEQHRRKLRELVSQERFEEASRLRDKIKSME